ncbi:MAG: MmgE/PrpD family protein [Clostridiales Family XIII bacterium]|jgi:2-methylcitrate dehydratase PrpD|nr:MmgE/PrpD family protein [Clostridiales Family XIII bacterium]
MSATLTQKLAEFAWNLKYDDIPPHVCEKIKTCVFHALCVGLAGYDLASVRLARNVVFAIGAADGGTPPCCDAFPGGGASHDGDFATLLGDGRKVRVMDAAFAGSVMLLSRVQGDTHGVTHTGPVGIPLALALAEAKRKSGKDFLTALTAAYEIMAAVGKDHTKACAARGFRAGSIYGVFGTATIAGLLLDLTEEQLAHALGFASGLAFGTTESLIQGSMEWRYQEGIAARIGMLSAMLAREGALSAPSALEGVNGFYRAFTGRTDPPSGILRDLGVVWESLNVRIKRYPTCIQNNSNVHNAICLARENPQLDPARIKHILVEMNAFEADYPGHKNWGPFKSQGQTLNSVPFCVATALLKRRLAYADLLLFEAPDVLDLVAKIEVEGREGINELCSGITVEMRDGTKYYRKLDVTSEFYSPCFREDVALIREMSDEIPLNSTQIDGLIDAVGSLELAQTVDPLIQHTIIGYR